MSGILGGRSNSAADHMALRRAVRIIEQWTTDSFDQSLKLGDGRQFKVTKENGAVSQEVAVR